MDKFSNIFILRALAKAYSEVRWKKWWKVEGKIEVLALLLSIAIVIPCWNNPLTLPIFFCFIAAWSFVKIFFRRDLWAFLFITGLFFFYKGITGLLVLYR
jgi:hypothetical protein